jgi:2-iminobutanoate/2-iminopropanoate deaminase
MSATRDIIHSPAVMLADRPSASAAVRGENFLFVSGLIAVDPQSGLRAPGTTASETRQILENLQQLLQTAGSSLEEVVKVNVLLHSMLEAPNMNDVYARFFPDPPPARTVCGARLPDGMKVMIECTALAHDPLRHGDEIRDATNERLARTAIAPKNPLLNASRAGNLPHVPGIRVGDYIFLSGMVSVDPQTGERSQGPIAEQVRVTLSNMRHMLESAGSSLGRVVRVNVVLADIAHMAEMDRVYREFFPVDPPARMVSSMQLRFGNGCEIECVALAG